MDDISKEVLSLLPKAEEQGVINKSQKMRIKELLMEDSNHVVEDILEEYKNTKDSSTLFSNFLSHLSVIGSDDELDENDKVKVSDLQSPEDVGLVRAKLNNLKKKSNKNQPTISNVNTCEDGLSPVVIFNSKKK